METELFRRFDEKSNEAKNKKEAAKISRDLRKRVLGHLKAFGKPDEDPYRSDNGNNIVFKSFIWAIDKKMDFELRADDRVLDEAHELQFRVSLLGETLVLDSKDPAEIQRDPDPNDSNKLFIKPAQATPHQLTDYARIFSGIEAQHPLPQTEETTETSQGVPAPKPSTNPA